LQKILISIAGKTCILRYQILPGGSRDGLVWDVYIAVQPSAELTRFNLKGLTPAMFCVNIADVVNTHHECVGVVENERQQPVARWQLDELDYGRALRAGVSRPNHVAVAHALRRLPGCVQAIDGQCLDFEAVVVVDAPLASGYQLSVVTEDVGERRAPFAFYSLDTHDATGWRGYPPPQAHLPPVRVALDAQLRAIAEAGIDLTQVIDETDYIIALNFPLWRGTLA
jgi:hypothetical protein